MKKQGILAVLLFCITLPLYATNDPYAAPLGVGMFMWGTGLSLALLSRKYPLLQNCIINYIHSLLGPEGAAEAWASAGTAYAVSLLCFCPYLCNLRMET